MSRRILAVDCGNSRLKWGVHDGDGWLAQGLLGYAELPQLEALLGSQPRADHAAACNVAGAEVGEAVAARLAGLGLPLHWVAAQPAGHGVRNLYEDPGQLGADRWAALVGARALHGRACLVVSAGTATTVDVLDGEGGFQGGLILPGTALMRRALAEGTARLPLADGRFSALPRNTMDAIASGCLLAQAGAIERMFEQVADLPGAACLVGGGAAGELFDLLRVPKRRVDHLALEGLARIGRDLAPLKPQEPS